MRGGTHIDGWNWNDVAKAARDAEGGDRYGLRREFVELVDRGQRIVANDDKPQAIAGE